MRAALSKLAIVGLLVLGLLQLCGLVHAHEAAMSLSQPAVSSLSSAVLVSKPDCPALSETDGRSDHQVQCSCSGGFMAVEAVAIRLPALAKTLQHGAADSDVAMLSPSPDPPPPRF